MESKTDKTMKTKVGGKGETLSSSFYVGKEETPCFKSGFKTWIRAVAFLIVAIFLPEQVSWAFEYNPAILWKTPSISLTSVASLNSAVTPTVFNKAVADSVYNFIRPLVNKNISQVQIKPGLNIEFNSKITNAQAREINQWLKNPETETVPCSTYVLYNLLKGQGKDVRVEELSSVLILIDLLSGNMQTKQ